MAKLTKHEYEWLTGWKGPPGAAYNAVYEFLWEDGCINQAGTPTPLGLAKMKEYEEDVSDSDE